ncbi:MAG: 30S ribosomal protein S20 [Candidatus Roizmanbacteria bacterium]|nr:30S ribosomal protein S20 [Candidatus Roizmanbacteria bacterium]
MPIIKSAIKKVRKDKKRTVVNSLYIKAYQATLKKIKKDGPDSKKLISLFYSQVDKAVKHNVIHKNKAIRLKSRVSKKISKKK